MRKTVFYLERHQLGYECAVALRTRLRLHICEYYNKDHLPKTLRDSTNTTDFEHTDSMDHFSKYIRFMLSYELFLTTETREHVSSDSSLRRKVAE
jgi:hypothetical protein